MSATAASPVRAPRRGAGTTSSDGGGRDGQRIGVASRSAKNRPAGWTWVRRSGRFEAGAVRSARRDPRRRRTTMARTSDEIDYELIGDDLQAVIVTLDPGRDGDRRGGRDDVHGAGHRDEHDARSEQAGRRHARASCSRVPSACSRATPSSSRPSSTMGAAGSASPSRRTSRARSSRWICRSGAASSSRRRIPSSARRRGRRWTSRSRSASAPASSAAKDSSCSASAATAWRCCTRRARSGRRRSPPGETLRVDTGCIVAMEQRVQYDIQMVPGIKTALFGGEGLFFATLTGPGTRDPADDALLATRRPDHRRRRRAPAERRQQEGSVLGGLGGAILGGVLGGDE